MKYHAYAIISSSKYLGEIEANSPEEAKEKASDLDECYVSVCHQCSKDIDDPQITEIQVEPSEA